MSSLGLGRYRKLGQVLFLCVLFYLCSIGVKFFLYPDLPAYSNSIRHSWVLCSRYVGEGSLYSGTAYCTNTPLVYYLGWFFIGLFGVSNINSIFSALIILSSVIVFLLLKAILDAKAP